MDGSATNAVANTSPRPSRRGPPASYRYVRLRWRLLVTLIDALGWLVVKISRRLGLRPVAGSAPEDPRRILLVQLDHLGDAIITTAMLPALRARYPRATIEVLAATWNHEVFAAQPQVDRVHVSQVYRFRRNSRLGWVLSTLRWGWKLRSRRFDLAIDVRGELPLAVMMWLTGARQRVGWDSGGGGFLLTHSPRFVPGRPEVQSRFALLESLGIDPEPNEEPRASRFEPPPAVRRRVGRLIDEIGGNSRPLLAVHVGSGTHAKRWPIEHWRELLGRMIVQWSVRIVLVGTREDAHLARAATGGLSWPNVFDWSGRFNISELAALLQRVDLLIGADSGPAHLAAAVQTPVVALFSGTNDPRQWQPSGAPVTVLTHPVDCSPCHRHTCPWKHHRCMRGLTPEVVLRHVRSACPALAEDEVALDQHTTAVCPEVSTGRVPAGGRLP